MNGRAHDIARKIRDECRGARLDKRWHTLMQDALHAPILRRLHNTVG